MSTSRVVRTTVVVTAVLCLLAAAGPWRVSGQQTPETPTFRTDASFVLTDVFVTKDGAPVTDLTAADFEVREDGDVQQIKSFEAIRHDLRPAVGLPRRSPSTVAESGAMASDPRRRVFVVFLDTYHVGKGDAMWVNKELKAFFRDSLGPDDLVAYMTPNMSGRDISFSTSTDPILAYIDANPVWGLADQMPFTESDAIEQNLSACFDGSKTSEADWIALRSRLREQKSLEALRGLMAYLDELRESRKAVIVATEGWRLFKENPTRMTDSSDRGRIQGVDPIGVDPGGVLGVDRRRQMGGAAQSQCDAMRMIESFANTQETFRDLIGEANRTSTSFYTVDVKGLRTAGRPGTIIAPAERREAEPKIDPFVEMRNRERTPYSTPLDSLRTLGESTNGMAIIDSNDVEGGMRRAAASFNAFYLLGYVSTNSRPDGRYRKIKVTVKRPGVQVRARDGYLSRKVEERPTTAVNPSAPTASVNPDEARITAALGRLAPVRAGTPLVLSAVAGTVAGAPTRVIRVTAELDAATAATPDWTEGGEAQAFVRNAKGETVTTAGAKLAKGARTVEIELPVVGGMSGEVKVQVRVSGTGALARYTDTTTVSLDAVPAGWGAPRLSRRGPSTGITWVPTADPRFRRQERLRVHVGLGPEAGTVAGTLLDRSGKPMNVPVKLEQPEPTAVVVEVALAPLAAGDYVLALGGGANRLFVPLRVVP